MDSGLFDQKVHRPRGAATHTQATTTPTNQQLHNYQELDQEESTEETTEEKLKFNDQSILRRR